MASMVDSRERKLDFAEIALIAIKNTDVNMPEGAAMSGIVTEASQPNTDIKQIGNTVFILHKGENGQGLFKALNADKARNFVENSRQYVVYAKKMGINMLVTQFQDRAISTLFHAISKNPPMPNMGFKEYKLKSGVRQIVLNLGQ